MKIQFVMAGTLALDGGSMFGVVPKTIWQRLNPPDENNLCIWAMRTLLIESGSRKILVDTGIGNKQSDKFRSHFLPQGKIIEDSLLDHAIKPEEITDVFLTHLHFDHVGGACTTNSDGKIVPTFPNATYWTNDKHYDWAYDPNPREKASFLKENFVPLREQGRLKMLSVQKDDMEWIEGLQIRFVYGHTEAQMLLIMPYEGSKAIYVADLIPSRWHVRIPYVMGYDMHASKTITEKERLLSEAVEHDYHLFFEHDPTMESARIIRDIKGRYTLRE